MLSGCYEHTIDAKGRVIIPSKFREKLGDTFVITQGYEGCLAIYSLEEWGKFTAKLEALPQSNPQARRVLRTFTADAAECELDKQGRTVIPPRLRAIAGLKKDVTIIGALTRVEIWDSERWRAYNSSEDAMSLEEAAASLEAFGF